MTRYYYNENPQVRHWMGKCAMLQQDLDAANETIDEICRYETKLEGEIIDLAESAIQFNSLPWYKKMFFKFKI